MAKRLEISGGVRVGGGPTRNANRTKGNGTGGTKGPSEPKKKKKSKAKPKYVPNDPVRYLFRTIAEASGLNAKTGAWELLRTMKVQVVPDSDVKVGDAEYDFKSH